MNALNSMLLKFFALLIVALVCMQGAEARLRDRMSGIKSSISSASATSQSTETAEPATDDAGSGEEDVASSSEE